jgi:hypothetical protein
MTTQPNLDRLVAHIVLDCTLRRWFAQHGRRDHAWAAIDLARSQTNITGDELRVLEFLDEHATNGKRLRP